MSDITRETLLAWIQASSNVDLLRVLLTTTQARLRDLQAAAAKEAPQILQPHVLVR